MAWTNSKIFAFTLSDALNGSVTNSSFSANTFKAALFDNTVTPSQTATSGATAYGSGTWASGGVSDSAQWPAAGRALTVSSATNGGSATYTFDANDLSGSSTTTTITNAYGCLIYEDTLTSPIVDQGWSYNYFGGANSVVLGTFTIVWSASGILSFAL